LLVEKWGEPHNLALLLVEKWGEPQVMVWGLGEGRISGHKTVILPPKPNRSITLEFMQLTPYDAKRLLAVVVFLHMSFNFPSFTIM
jgi:hypothetical protein